MKKGGISVQTDNIFPVIKKWLYSDKEIFLRELVSNACDAITRHKRLASLSEAEESNDPYCIKVVVDKVAKTLTVSDNGIGMTEEELDKYINNMAISGALEFISKYEGEDGGASGIIGHFGLGFYSAFMVSDNVEIDTKSYTCADAVHWDCKEDGNYEMEPSDKEGRGSDIVLHISEKELEYLDFAKIKSILQKYCSYMPYSIYCVENDKEELINTDLPVWQKSPTEVTEDEYNKQYRALFADYRDPLFCVHINADYPLNFKGVLYFPSQRNNFEPKEGVIKLFYNSVFVADNIKEVVPDYLSCLSGALDCPELPLNVSRSYLQDDSYVRKLSAHIVKKIADKLCKLKNDDFDKYSKLWGTIKPYLEYGCIKDQKFSDRIKSAILFEKTDNSFTDMESVVSADENSRIYYTTDPIAQSCYIEMFSSKGIPVYVFDTVVDAQFISFVESKNEKIKFMRVDASIEDLGDDSEANENLKNLFVKATNKTEDKISFASLGQEGAAALLKISEEERRFSDMMRMYSVMNGEGGTMATEESLVINVDNEAVKKLAELSEAKALVLAKNIYYMALVANRQLNKEELNDMLNNIKEVYSLI
ncbi:MAG: molecular chaperone HtpG [Ruminococcaceae bacterium]|nr:molecular chaperone HtpG [Oscillospiraceae bacterium]